MKRLVSWLLRLLAVLVALVTAFIELDLVFSDFGPGETSASRIRTILLVAMAGAALTLLLWLLARRASGDQSRHPGRPASDLPGGPGHDHRPGR